MIKESPTRQLEGRVAALLSAAELVLNIGAQAGVQTGDVFAVLTSKPFEINDPQTGELLDTIEREKIRVEAVEVRDRIAICRPVEDIQHLPVRQGIAAQVGIDSQEPSGSVLPREESYVKVNDRAILVAAPTTSTSSK